MTYDPAHGTALPAILLAFTREETKQTLTPLRDTDPMNPTPNSNDEIGPDVVRRIASGDVAAFELLYDALSGILYSLGVRMLERREDVEELLQEIFIKIWKEADRYDPRRGAPLAWAITMTRHRAIDKIRSINRRLHLKEAAKQEGAGAPSPTGAGPMQAATKAENAKAVQDSLKDLAPDVREIIELAYFSGLSQSQISEHLSLPLTTVKSRMRRAMIQLRHILRDHSA